MSSVTSTETPAQSDCASSGTAQGVSLALACDLRICPTAAKFTTAFTAIGLTPDSGLSATLTRAVGAARASELILLAEPFTAQQALDWGLVSRLTGRTACSPRPWAWRPAWRPARRWPTPRPSGPSRPPRCPPGDVLAAEAQAQARLGLTADHRDAVQAFLAKRPPEFHGH